MKRVKNFFVQSSVLVIACVLNVIGYVLKNVIKFHGLDPDVSPYQKHLAHMQQAFTNKHDTSYDNDFDLSKYVKGPLYSKGVRPSFKFNDKPAWSGSLSSAHLQITEPSLSIKDGLEKAVNNIIAERKKSKSPRLKKMVSQIKKAGAVKSRKNNSKKIVRKVA